MSLLTPTRSTAVGPRYKWLVLSNTTIGMLLATMNGTSLIIALPVIFRGIRLNPLQAASFPYLLWIMMGYMPGVGRGRGDRGAYRRHVRPA